MQVATYGDAPEADQDIPEEEWPDIEHPPQAAEEGEASKSAGKAGEGEGGKAVGKSTLAGAEGGAEAPPNTAQAPTENPKIHNQVPEKARPRTPLTTPWIPKQVMTQVLRNM